jgi:hypothetical protein
VLASQAILESGSPRPKKFKAQKSSSKVLASVFWDKDGILLVDYLDKLEGMHPVVLV